MKKSAADASGAGTPPCCGALAAPPPHARVGWGGPPPAPWNPIASRAPRSRACLPCCAPTSAGAGGCAEGPSAAAAAEPLAEPRACGSQAPAPEARPGSGSAAAPGRKKLGGCAAGEPAGRKKPLGVAPGLARCAAPGAGSGSALTALAGLRPSRAVTPRVCERSKDHSSSAVICTLQMHSCRPQACMALQGRDNVDVRLCAWCSEHGAEPASKRRRCAPCLAARAQAGHPLRLLWGATRESAHTRRTPCRRAQGCGERRATPGRTRRRLH